MARWVGEIFGYQPKAFLGDLIMKIVRADGLDGWLDHTPYDGHQTPKTEANLLETSTRILPASRWAGKVW